MVYSVVEEECAEIVKGAHSMVRLKAACASSNVSVVGAILEFGFSETLTIPVLTLN